MQRHALSLLLVLGIGLTTSDGLAHPGHGSKAVVGTLKEVSREAMVIEVLDPGAGGVTRVRVAVNQETRFRLDKEAPAVARTLHRPPR